MRKKYLKMIFNTEVKLSKKKYWYENLGFNFFYYYLKIRSFFSKKDSIIHFVYETNTQCTLRCKECHSYMPYFTKEAHYMTNFETFKAEIDKLLKSVDLIVSFRLQGGETLLVKDLAKMVEYVCSKKQILHIQIISNGTIIPSEELIKAMQNPKVLLSLSDYSINKKLTSRLKYDEILQICKDNNIDAKHWLTKAGDSWVNRNYISNENLKDRELAIKNLAACHCFGYPKCLILFKGKLYICAPAVYFASTNPDFYIPEGDVIDVMNTPQKLLTKWVKEFNQKKYFDLCSRCNAAENVNVRTQPGVQLEETQTLVAVESNPAKSI